MQNSILRSPVFWGFVIIAGALWYLHWRLTEQMETNRLLLAENRLLAVRPKSVTTQTTVIEQPSTLGSLFDMCRSGFEFGTALLKRLPLPETC